MVAGSIPAGCGLYRRNRKRLNPRYRIRLELAQWVRDGLHDAGGAPIEFLEHPLFARGRGL